MYDTVIGLLFNTFTTRSHAHMKEHVCEIDEPWFNSDEYYVLHLTLNAHIQTIIIFLTNNMRHGN